MLNYLIFRGDHQDGFGPGPDQMASNWAKGNIESKNLEKLNRENEKLISNWNRNIKLKNNQIYFPKLIHF